ncbi:late 16kDa putative membrane protein [Salmon gill poxvirus]|nr:late 16kDa putative membrane protein [Salmon gill poxvirus]
MLKSDIDNLNYCFNKSRGGDCSCMLKYYNGNYDKKSKNFLCDINVCPWYSVMTRQMIKDKGDCNIVNCTVNINSMNINSNDVLISNTCGAEAEVSNMITADSWSKEIITTETFPTRYKIYLLPFLFIALIFFGLGYNDFISGQFVGDPVITKGTLCIS